MGKKERKINISSRLENLSMYHDMERKEMALTEDHNRNDSDITVIATRTPRQTNERTSTIPREGLGFKYILCELQSPRKPRTIIACDSLGIPSNSMS